MTITLKFNLPDDFFGDILDIARGCCEWVETHNTQLTRAPCYIVSFEARPHWEEGKPFPEDDNRNDWTLVNHIRIEEAIQKIIDGELTNQPTRDTIFDAVCEGDTCHIDADCADAILQIAMYDEIVFG